jgi:hypothetical protein
MKSECPNNGEAERIDKEISQACKHGANECRRHPLHYWSVELHELKRELSLYCQFRRRRKKGLDSKALVARTAELGIRLSIDMSDGVIEDRIDETEKESENNPRKIKRTTRQVLVGTGKYIGRCR